MTLSVRLMIFSGRRDPEFAIEEDALDDLTTRVAAAIEGDEAAPPPDVGLGYRGFRVTNPEGLEGAPPEFTVFRGVLSVGSEPSVRHVRDRSSVEAFLIAKARDNGLGGILAAAGIEGQVG
jgi:hypothetical protein